MWAELTSTWLRSTGKPLGRGGRGGGALNPTSAAHRPCSQKQDAQKQTAAEAIHLRIGHMVERGCSDIPRGASVQLLAGLEANRPRVTTQKLPFLGMDADAGRGC